jgi:hypothetical protein
MPQVVECGECGKKLRASDELAGLKVRCPRCQSTVRVPVATIGPPPTLDVWEPDEPSASQLPPRAEAESSQRPKKSSRRSRNGSAWPPLSRWWTLIGGVLLVVVAFLLPQVGLVAAAIVGAISAVAMMIIVFALAGPFIIEHPFLVLQLLLFGMGVSRHTRDQRQRELARFRSLWPALSHSCLGLISFGVALSTGLHSPFLPKDSMFALKRNRQPQAIARPALPVAAAAAQDFPEAEAVLTDQPARRTVATPIRLAPAPAITAQPVIPAPEIGTELVRPSPPVAAEILRPVPEIGTDRPHLAPSVGVNPAGAGPAFAASQQQAINAAQQAMQRAQQRAMEMHQKMLQRRRDIRRRAVPVNPSQDSATTPPSNPQAGPGPRPGGL